MAIAMLVAGMTWLPGCGGSGGGVRSGPGPALVAIKIAPSTSLLLLGSSRQLTATGIYSNGVPRDLTSEVTWSVEPAANATNYVSVNATGVATGVALGSSVVTATLGSVVGVLDLLVNTNGYSSSTISILPVPYKNTVVDAAYVPASQTMIQGAYAVQEVNLDADQFSSVIPAPAALLASIPMPSGFVPNATAASQVSMKVAVISYSSPNVQIIDASNVSTDATNNAVIATFTAPVSQTVTFNGNSCMICAAVVNPTTDQLLLSTAQGYYTMDLTAGTFTAVPFTPTAFPATSFSLNPVAADSYILSPTYGVDPNLPGEVQVLNLATNAVTTNTFGLTAPDATAIDIFTGYSAVVEANTSNEALVNLTVPQNPVSALAPNVNVCSGEPSQLNMVALGVSANVNQANTNHTLFVSQTLGNCVGFEEWPSLPGPGQLEPSAIPYAYGSMPSSPDGNAFANGSDPNAITTFTSVVDKNNYGLVVDANQQWIAKINFATVFARTFTGSSNPTLPVGEVVPPIALSTGIGGDPVIFLPTPSSTVTLSATSLDGGTQNVGTSSAPVPITLTNVSTTNPLSISQIAIQGSDAGDFSYTDTCGTGILPQTSCAINVTFTPTATGQRCAMLSVTDNGGESPQSVSLSGIGAPSTGGQGCPVSDNSGRSSESKPKVGARS